ncbi:MAG TPA: hypothetical protein VFJ16_20975 [Longimicrobium sp.]|nr:hypothetical protein [Longimicrobium sp.]
MRRAAFAPLVLALVAACADQATLPGPLPPPGGITASAAISSPAGEITVSAARTVAWNEGGWEAGNVPFAEAGGGRVVWQDASGPLVVRAYDFASGTQTKVAEVYGDFAYPHTAGRWVVWSDERQMIHLRDQATGAVRDLGPGFTPRVSAEGRVAYIRFDRPNGVDARNRNVAVYDAATGSTRVLTHYTEGVSGGDEAHEPTVDGNIVVWTVLPVYPNYTSTIRMMNLATGEERELYRINNLLATRVSVSSGRIVWAERLPDRSAAVMLYDVSTGARRQITPSGARPSWDPRISGGLVVWEDGRNSTSARMPENDIYAFDLASGREIAVAAGPNHQGWPSVDGDRVVWTELANGRWEIRTATVQTVSLEALGRAVDGMLASGEFRNRGAAESLRAFIAQATRARDAGDVAGQRAALQRLAQHVRSLGGKQLGSAAAARLAAMADALMRSLGG